MQERKSWFQSLAVSAIHKCLRKGDVETAAYAAAWLITHFGKQGALSAWRRVLAFPSEDLGGEGAEKVAALYLCWHYGYEDDHLFCAILYLCRLLKHEEGRERKPGMLEREADELKAAALYWIQSKKYVPPPDEAFDHHTGATHDTVFWWETVNRISEPSQWRKDAMKLDVSAYKNRRVTSAQRDAQGSLFAEDG